MLLSADGLTGPQIAGRVGCTEPTVVKWRRQYAERGLAGLEDAPRPGGPKTVLTDKAISEILSATVTPPPESLQAMGVTHWSSRRLAAWLHRTKKLEISHDSIIRLWRRFCLEPQRSEGSSSPPTRNWKPSRWRMTRGAERHQPAVRQVGAGRWAAILIRSARLRSR